MADLKFALPWVLQHEGGWSCNPNDPGGATNKGITIGVARLHGLDLDGLKNITDDQLESIYRQDYWRFDGVKSQAVATKLFDMAVNMGLRSAVKLAQEAMLTFGVDLKQDGFWGPNTETAINASDPTAVVDALCQRSVSRYMAIALMHPESQVFLKGWIKRAEDKP